MRILVTAGPTREYLDDVRFLSNASSGRLGYEIARVAHASGHRVTLLSGPVLLGDPPGLRVIRVVSAAEMFRHAVRLAPRIDCVVAAAAVSDYQPLGRQRGKPPKQQGTWNLPLKATPDLLHWFSRHPPSLKLRQARLRRGSGGQAGEGWRVLIGFALENPPTLAKARKKLRAKRLDLILLNSPATLGASQASGAFVWAEGGSRRFSRISKRALARRIVLEAERLWEERSLAASSQEAGGSGDLLAHLFGHLSCTLVL